MSKGPTSQDNKLSGSNKLSLPEARKPQADATASGALAQETFGESLTPLSVVSGQKRGQQDFQRDNAQEIIEGRTSFEKTAYFDSYSGVSWQRYFKMDIHGENAPIKRSTGRKEREHKPERELPELAITRRENLNVFYYSHGKLYRKNSDLVGDFGFDPASVDLDQMKFLYCEGLLRDKAGEVVAYHGRAMTLGDQTAIVVVGPPPGSGPVFLPQAPDQPQCSHDMIFVPVDRVLRFCKEKGIEPHTALSEDFAIKLKVEDDGYSYLVDRHSGRLRMSTVKVGSSVTRYLFDRHVSYTLVWKKDGEEHRKIVEEWISDPTIRINY